MHEKMVLSTVAIRPLVEYLNDMGIWQTGGKIPLEFVSGKADKYVKARNEHTR